MSRIGLGTARPRDLAQLRTALHTVPRLREAIAGADSPRIEELTGEHREFPEMAALLDRAVVDAPPVLVRDGGVLAAGYDAELDELRRLSTDADSFLEAFEARERERTGAANLRVGYNRVHGYYIELSKAQSERAPDDYVRRQTLKGAERYITAELEQFEERVLGARERALALEKALYDELVARVAADLEALQRSALAIAELDVLCNFAERAESLDYRAPRLDEAPGMRIEGGRHPVVEQASSRPFIPNDVTLDDSRRMLVVTGPNMGGKSTLMRQTALIALLAYAGSFVPATSARIGPIDRIFTRIGAGDDLAGGRSTFMVEMTEMARILNNATPRSLVLVDEIGRGTSTYDGLALAWACARELAHRTRSFTLFATHYFELTELPRHADGVANVHLDAIEHGRKIVFMHRVKEGPANRSYGLAVAALAGDSGRRGGAGAGNPRHAGKARRARASPSRLRRSSGCSIRLRLPPARSSWKRSMRSIRTRSLPGRPSTLSTGSRPSCAPDHHVSTIRHRNRPSAGHGGRGRGPARRKGPLSKCGGSDKGAIHPLPDSAALRLG